VLAGSTWAGHRLQVATETGSLEREQAFDDSLLSGVMNRMSSQRQRSSSAPESARIADTSGSTMVLGRG
jgi:hypothetical protein